MVPVRTVLLVCALGLGGTTGPPGPANATGSASAPGPANATDITAAVAEGTPPQERWFLGPVRADQPRVAGCTAKSARRDPRAMGFGPSANSPRHLPPDSPFAQGTIQLVALPDTVEYFEWRHDGFVLLLVNDSAGELELWACDSRLPIVREGQDERGEWRPIEYLARSWCGNSYHRVYLLPRQYWRFAVPVYAGEPHRMRFRVKLTDGREIVSNEFVSTMQPGQFEGIGPDGKLVRRPPFAPLLGPPAPALKPAPAPGSAPAPRPRSRGAPR